MVPNTLIRRPYVVYFESIINQALGVDEHEVGTWFITTDQMGGLCCFGHAHWQVRSVLSTTEQGCLSDEWHISMMVSYGDWINSS
jgi:hypothetical protein